MVEKLVSFINIDDLKNKKKAGIFLASVGALQFIILTIIAVFTYPRPYNFIMEQFSILGLLDANWPSRFQGGFPQPPLPNPISSVLFIIAIIIVAISMIPFWILLPPLFEADKKTKILSKIGSIIGLISSPFLVGVAFPADVYFTIHMFGALSFFFLFSIAIFTYSIAILLNESYPNINGIFGIIVCAVGVAYIFVPLSPLNAFHQKITVYLFISWAFIQALRLWNEV